MQQLNVYLHNRMVGVLSSDKGKLQFIYSQDYLQLKDAEPLAFTLPLTNSTYQNSAVVSFFSNLLPDESVRVRIAEILGISPENTFGLLQAIGEDCAGAISLFVPEKQPAAVNIPIYKPLTEDEAHKVLVGLPERPLNIGEKDFHISGAGAQDKLVASVRDGQILLPLNGTPSTHIIKPGMERFPESVFNELYCMKLAKKCGLNCAECDIIFIKDIPYYITARYDRKKENDLWYRLHQEDFCQLLGYEPSVKYESEGGPKIQQCFALLRELELPANDTIEFIDRIIFNFLIGNGDAHAKNFSILYTDTRPILAPAYDLISTAVYPAIEQRMAMKIDNEYTFRWITIGKFIRMGEKAGFSEKIILKEIQKMQKILHKNIDGFTADIKKKYPANIYDKIYAGIINRIEQLKQ